MCLAQSERTLDVVASDPPPVELKLFSSKLRVKRLSLSSVLSLSLELCHSTPPMLSAAALAAGFRRLRLIHRPLSFRLLWNGDVWGAVGGVRKHSECLEEHLGCEEERFEWQEEHLVSPEEHSVVLRTFRQPLFWTG